MLVAAALLVVAALGAQGDIHRCVGADGRARYQDAPCPGARASAKVNTENPAELRRWLERLRRESRRAQPPVAADKTARPAQATVPRATSSWGAPDERLLASCSQRFLDCANGNAVAMDACVAKSPRCGSGRSGACCPERCVTRYADLRAIGAPMASAVRDALLDPTAPSCAAR